MAQTRSTTHRQATMLHRFFETAKNQQPISSTRRGSTLNYVMAGK
ncbi:hypothetical protein [Xenorhabdus bovienii]|nr:hypothetical protein [Xenorhabdus bovienii]